MTPSPNPEIRKLAEILFRSLVFCARLLAAEYGFHLTFKKPPGNHQPLHPQTTSAGVSKES